jgi:hypothetical protein
MIGATKRFVRLTGAGFALVVALALGTGPVLAAQEKGFRGCLDEAVEDFGECLEGAEGFWDRVGCGVFVILDALGCASDAVINAF